MNLKELAEKLSEQFEINKSDMNKIIEAAIAKITEALAKGEKVRLVGFGHFSVKTRKGRIGRDPRSGKEINIAPTKCPVFVAGYNLKKAIRGK